MKLILILLATFNFSIANAQSVLGQWGGEGASVWITPNGGDAEMNCSFGRITEPVRADADGNFSAAGYIDYYDGTPPIKRMPAVYSGSVVQVEVEDDDDYELMKLTVKMPREEWNFELREDVIGQTYECAVRP